MSYREKVQWVTLMAMLFAWGGYFSSVYRSLHAVPVEPLFEFGAFAGAIAMLVGIQVLGTIAVALMRPSEAEQPADIRKRAIENRAGAVAYQALTLAGVAVLIVGPFTHLISLNGLGHAPDVVLICNLLLAALVFGALVNTITQLILYRRQG